MMFIHDRFLILYTETKNLQFFFSCVGVCHVNRVPNAGKEEVAAAVNATKSVLEAGHET